MTGSHPRHSPPGSSMGGRTAGSGDRSDLEQLPSEVRRHHALCCSREAGLHPCVDPITALCSHAYRARVLISCWVKREGSWMHSCSGLQCSANSRRLFVLCSVVCHDTLGQGVP